VPAEPTPTRSVKLQNRTSCNTQWLLQSVLEARRAAWHGQAAQRDMFARRPTRRTNNGTKCQYNNWR
jgi:hypothetical protein